MAQTTVDVKEAPSRFGELLLLVRSGTEITLTEGDKTVARLVPAIPRTEEKRIAGLHQDAMTTSEDFDAPLPDTFWVENA